MTPKEFYENLEEKKPFTELTSTGISDNLTNVFEFAKMYAEAITVTRCCKSDSELLKAFRKWWNKDNQGVCTTITHKDIERYLESL